MSHQEWPVSELLPLAAAHFETGEARPRPAHVTVGPLSVFNGTLPEAVSLCVDAMRAGTGMRVATANLDFLARARRDGELRADLERSDLVVADGAPVAWLARLAGGRRTRRVAGVDLVGDICREGAAAGGLCVVFYGSTPEIAEEAASRLEAANPGLRVVATICPPFRELTAAETAAERRQISEARPDLVLVALGCPKQERLIARYFDAAPSAVWIGVGGTFDFYAGKRRRAPKLLQAVGGEWLARLAQEPGRLWRRYFVDDLPALVATLPGCLFR